MAVVQVQLPDRLQATIDQQIAAGRIAREADFLIEAASRFAEDLAAEDDIVAVAEAGIADMDAGRFVTISGPDDAEALHQRAIARLRARLESGHT